MQDRQSPANSNLVLLSILSALVVGSFAVTNQSLWIDEASSALKAMQPSLAHWWQTLAREKGSDLQMPFYMFYLWAWAKLFGTSEIALRAANVPWFVIGVVALVRSFRQDRHLSLPILVLSLTNAFLWYYVSEARPYIVLFAFSALTASCLFRLHDNSGESFRWFLAGIVGVCATNLIAVPWAIAAIAAFAFWSGTAVIWQTMKRFILSILSAAIALGGLALFYLWTLRLGARASDIGPTSIANLAFVFYELFGIAGLGPGRLALRNEGLRTLNAYAPCIAIGTLVTLGLVVAAIAHLRSKITRRDFFFFAIAIAVPAAIILVGGAAAHMRLLGRHFTPALPFILVFLAIGFRQLFFSDRRWRRGLAAAAAVSLLVSALQIRFAPRHQRDDYRSATQLANHSLSTGDNVWWLADETAAAYYRLEVDVPNLSLGRNLDAAAIQNGADVIYLSKRDIYDPSGKIDNYIRQHHFTVTRTLPAFQIFEPSVR